MFEISLAMPCISLPLRSYLRDLHFWSQGAPWSCFFYLPWQWKGVRIFLSHWRGSKVYPSIIFLRVWRILITQNWQYILQNSKSLLGLHLFNSTAPSLAPLADVLLLLNTNSLDNLKKKVPYMYLFLFCKRVFCLCTCNEVQKTSKSSSSMALMQCQ